MGPLLVYGDSDYNLAQAARNIPGVDVCNVTRLNILQLAPGGHLGRFVVYTKSAFTQLDTVFSSANKKGYTNAKNVMECADLARIINSDQVQAVLRAMKDKHVRVHDKTKKNALTNKALMHKLNPFARKKALSAKRNKSARKTKKTRDATWNGLQDGLKASFKAAEDQLAEEAKAGNYVPGDTSSEEEDD